MKQILFLGICIFALIQVKAQPGSGNAAMNVGEIYGKVLVGNTNKGFDAASIQIVQIKLDSLKNKKEQVIAGQLTGSNGEFRLNELPLFGNIMVKITAIGYETIEMPLKYNFSQAAIQKRDMQAIMAGALVDLGNLRLIQKTIKEKDVVVVGERAALQLGIDRKVFNVDKNIVSAGGSGIDVLRNVPSVQVDIDGNVTMRNASPQIFVDGRPTPLTLDQIPADAIASVELITNPSAKYDASGGTAGIINVVLKKNKKIGYYGNLRTNIDSRAKVGAGGDFNIRQGKINFAINAMYNQRKSISWGESIRNNYYTNPNTSLLQNNQNESEGSFRFIRPGIDYFLNNRNTFSVSSNIVRGTFNPLETIDIYQSNLSGVSNAFKSYRNIKSRFNFESNNLNAGYKHLFTKPNQEITADITYSKSRNFAKNNFENAPYIMPEQNTVLQYIQGNGGRENITFQTDYTHPLKNEGKIEAGIRFNQFEVLSINNSYIKTPNSNNFVFIPATSNNFESVEKVYAAYATYSKKINKTAVQLGLRWEGSQYDGNLISSTQKFSNQYPKSFFPSLFITHSLANNQDIQINYTRKINRPNFFQLVPFIDYTDSLNVTKGNPGLLPEFTDNIELSYQKTYRKSDNFIGSIYYKNTTNLIARFQNKEFVGAQEFIINSYINANQSMVYGIELTNKTAINSALDVAANANFYGSKLNVPGLPTITDNFNFFGKLNTNLRLPKNLSVQVSGDYQGRTTLPPGGNGGGSSFGGGGGQSNGPRGMMGTQTNNTQGYIKANWGVDFAIKKDFLKDRKASISLNVNDIFRTKVNWLVSETALFYQDSWRRRDPQVFRLNFSYKFGKFDTSIFKRKNMRMESGGMDTGM
jgi:outer membrane receptor protein involved in Fe transport